MIITRSEVLIDETPELLLGVAVIDGHHVLGCGFHLVGSPLSPGSVSVGVITLHLDRPTCPGDALNVWHIS